jgi:cytochrome c oxidase cbb3-type subunit I/II
MATFEGPMMSLKSVNAISHYTDWTIAHVHIGALGWNGFMTFGMLYWLIPRLFKTELYSKKLASTHFWIGTLGIVLYAIPLYWAAFRSYFMLKAFTPEGQLQYQFIDVVQSVVPFYTMRAVGGTIYLIGAILMIYNLYKTTKTGVFVEREEAEAAPLPKKFVATGHTFWHTVIERKPILMLILSFVVVAIGGLVEIVPTLVIKSNIPTIASVKPYTPLELQGRDIYIREGCYTCHSQMIRPFRYEVMRYGEYSKAGEFVYDHPYQWGSKRTGPDLARIGGKYPDSWHFNHMLKPTSMSPGSIMPNYPWLFRRDLDISTTNSKIHAMRKLGVPYEQGYEAKANNDLQAQADKITARLKADKIDISSKKEIIALIAYLQRVGKDIKASQTTSN